MARSGERAVPPARARTSLDWTDRTLRGVLVGMGAVAAVTGTSVAITGTRAIPGGAPVSASTDSVLRFYGVVWAAQGPRLWRLSRQDRLPWGELPAVCLTTFLGGLARVAAARHSGPPHKLFQVLTFAELGLPPVLLLLRGRQPSSDASWAPPRVGD